VQAVDEHDLERDVQHVGADRDAQRRARVGQPDQVPVPGEGQVQERNPHGGRPQVADRADQHVLRAPSSSATQGAVTATSTATTIPPAAATR
jgi:hypothetical protein